MCTKIDLSLSLRQGKVGYDLKFATRLISPNSDPISDQNCLLSLPIIGYIIRPGMLNLDLFSEFICAHCQTQQFKIAMHTPWGSMHLNSKGIPHITRTVI